MFARRDRAFQVSSLQDRNLNLNAFRHLDNIFTGQYPLGDEFLKRISHLDLSGKVLYSWLTSDENNLSRVQESQLLKTFVNAMVEGWSTKEWLDKVKVARRI